MDVNRAMRSIRTAAGILALLLLAPAAPSPARVDARAVPGSGGGGVAPERVPRDVVVVPDTATVLAAPVVDAPEAGEVARGDRLTSVAVVNGEAIDGDVRWHLVVLSTEPELVRGFVHNSLVEPAP